MGGKIKLFMTDKLKKFMHLNCVRERKKEWREIYIEKVFLLKLYDSFIAQTLPFHST